MCCHYMGYSFQIGARDLLYASSHRQYSTYHGLCYTNGTTLAGGETAQWVHYGRSIWWTTTLWVDALPHLAPGPLWEIDLMNHCTMSGCSTTSRSGSTMGDRSDEPLHYEWMLYHISLRVHYGRSIWWTTALWVDALPPHLAPSPLWEIDLMNHCTMSGCSTTSRSGCTMGDRSDEPLHYEWMLYHISLQVHYGRSISWTTALWVDALPHLALGPLWEIDLMNHCTMSGCSTTSRSGSTMGDRSHEPLHNEWMLYHISLRVHYGRSIWWTTALWVDALPHLAPGPLWEIDLMNHCTMSGCSTTTSRSESTMGDRSHEPLHYEWMLYHISLWVHYGRSIWWTTALWVDALPHLAPGPLWEIDLMNHCTMSGCSTTSRSGSTMGDRSDEPLHYEWMLYHISLRVHYGRSIWWTTALWVDALPPHLAPSPLWEIDLMNHCTMSGCSTTSRSGSTMGDRSDEPLHYEWMLYHISLRVHYGRSIWWTTALWVDALPHLAPGPLWEIDLMNHCTMSGCSTTSRSGSTMGDRSDEPLHYEWMLYHISLRVHYGRSIWWTTALWVDALPPHLAPSPLWEIDLMNHHTMSGCSTTSRSDEPPHYEWMLYHISLRWTTALWVDALPHLALGPLWEIDLMNHCTMSGCTTTSRSGSTMGDRSDEPLHYEWMLYHISLRVHYGRSISWTTALWVDALPHLALGPLWEIDLMNHCTMSGCSTTSRSGSTMGDRSHEPLHYEWMLYHISLRVHYGRSISWTTALWVDALPPHLAPSPLWEIDLMNHCTMSGCSTTSRSLSPLWEIDLMNHCTMSGCSTTSRSGSTMGDRSDEPLHYEWMLYHISLRVHYGRSIWWTTALWVDALPHLAPGPLWEIDLMNHCTMSGCSTTSRSGSTMGDRSDEPLHYEWMLYHISLRVHYGRSISWTTALWVDALPHLAPGPLWEIDLMNHCTMSGCSTTSRSESTMGDRSHEPLHYEWMLYHISLRVHYGRSISWTTALWVDALPHLAPGPLWEIDLMNHCTMSGCSTTSRSGSTMGDRSHEPLHYEWMLYHISLRVHYGRSIWWTTALWVDALPHLAPSPLWEIDLMNHYTMSGCSTTSRSKSTMGDRSDEPLHYEWMLYHISLRVHYGRSIWWTTALWVDALPHLAPSPLWEIDLMNHCTMSGCSTTSRSKSTMGDRSDEPLHYEWMLYHISLRVHYGRSIWWTTALWVDALPHLAPSPLWEIDLMNHCTMSGCSTTSRSGSTMGDRSHEPLHYEWMLYHISLQVHYGRSIWWTTALWVDALPHLAPSPLWEIDLMNHCTMSGCSTTSHSGSTMGDRSDEPLHYEWMLYHISLRVHYGRSISWTTALWVDALPHLAPGPLWEIDLMNHCTMSGCSTTTSPPRIQHYL